MYLFSRKKYLCLNYLKNNYVLILKKGQVITFSLTRWQPWVRTIPEGWSNWSMFVGMCSLLSLLQVALNVALQR